MYLFVVNFLIAVNITSQCWEKISDETYHSIAKKDVEIL